MLDDYNATRDTGSGSQFYAKVASFNGKDKVFENGSDKFHLGEWQLVMFWDGVDENGNTIGGSEELEEGEVKVGVPYFSDGKTINIHEANTDKLALSIDVSKFSICNINTLCDGKENYENCPADCKVDALSGLVPASRQDSSETNPDAFSENHNLIYILAVCLAVIVAFFLGFFIWRKKFKN